MTTTSPIIKFSFVLARLIIPASQALSLVLLLLILKSSDIKKVDFVVTLSSDW